MAAIDAKERRKQLDQWDKDASELRDKSILAVAGAALGISVTFVWEIPTAVNWLWILAVAWASLTASVLTMVASIGRGRAAVRHMMAEIDNAAKSHATSTVTKGGIANRATDWLNRMAFVTLIIGVISMALFVICNLPW